MTDEEIVKALECCGLNKDCCNEFPYAKDTIALINRQKAEIERLKDKVLSQPKTVPKLIKQIKAEAIKEFAENVKTEFYTQFDELIPSIMADRIDSLVEEMVGAK